MLKGGCSCKSRGHVWVHLHYSNDAYGVVWQAKPNIHSGVLIFMVAHIFLGSPCNQKSLSFPLVTFSFLIIHGIEFFFQYDPHLIFLHADLIFIFFIMIYFYF